jgi:hypothetical protein
MAQDLTVNIKTTSDVPQAMDKAKAATGSFSKQVEDIQKKFSTAFKDIFLSFLGPMALLGIAINYIGKLIEENQRKHKEANQAAIDGTNELMSAEDRYYAKKRDNEKKDKENREQAAMSREDITKDFLLNDPIGRAIMQLKGAGEQNRPGFLKPLSNVSREERAGRLAQSPEIQSAVQLAIMDQAKKNPLPSERKDFKGPEGFGNVIGVGANPVMEAMNAQLEEQRKTNSILEKIAGDPGATSWMNSTTSRAALLMGK